MTEKQTAEIFGFIKAAEAYLNNMVERGDDSAKNLHMMAFDILAEHGEADHLDPEPIKETSNVRENQ